MENRLEDRRAGLALIAAGVLTAVFALYAGLPALASHQLPDDILEQGAGTNDPGYWENIYLPNVRGISDASCFKIDSGGGSAFVMPPAPDGEDWVLLVVKQATTNYIYYDPVAGHSYPSTGDQSPGYSHTILCSITEPTTTTTQPTTTTTQPTTTTTQATTTTSITDEVLGTVITTTTTVPDEVLGTEVTASTLPFTGSDTDSLALMAVALLGGGILIALGARSIEKNHST